MNCYHELQTSLKLFQHSSNINSKSLLKQNVKILCTAIKRRQTKRVNIDLKNLKRFKVPTGRIQKKQRQVTYTGAGGLRSSRDGHSRRYC